MGAALYQQQVSINSGGCGGGGGGPFTI